MSPCQLPDISEHNRHKFIAWMHKRKRIDEMSSARRDRFARVCRSCHSKEPRQRFIATECGHAVCCRCADGSCICPVCFSTSKFVRLFEDESRECGICMEIPRERDFFSACGHLICSACAIQMWLDDNFICPFCRTESDWMQTLKEEVIKPPKSRRNRQTAYNRTQNQHKIDHRENRSNQHYTRLNQPQKRFK